MVKNEPIFLLTSFKPVLSNRFPTSSDEFNPSTEILLTKHISSAINSFFIIFVNSFIIIKHYFFVFIYCTVTKSCFSKILKSIKAELNRLVLLNKQI
ncbi:hypothetical protein BpHYR1_031390 [Brachionus plicatilis]|uniref:Uncharacterized protein n=1 Tax=Brachionus plicatilis TaxID=10195 RepID=A0A3M7S5J6_BRAPC|nr:hypothetical protein BpHYR1_031390 [Brachionus plicatilis]